MSENRFVVEVVGKPNETPDVTVSRVQDALGLDDTRARALVARMPGVLTRPSTEGRAMKVALRLQAAGVVALHRPLRPSEDPFSSGEGSVAAPPATNGEAAGGSDGAVSAGAAGTTDDVGAPVPPMAPDDPSSAPSVDATYWGTERDPKLTPMSEAGFGAADIVLPTDVPDDVRSTQERLAERRVKSTFVEAGTTSEPARAVEPGADATDGDATHAGVPGTDDEATARGARRWVDPAEDEPEAVPGRPVVPRPDDGDGRAGTPVPDRRDVDARHAEPVYRQKRSAAEPPLTLSPPPDDVLRRSGVAETEIAASSERRRGRFGRRMATQVALPVLATWPLGAVATWFLLPADARVVLFVPIAAVTAIATLLGALIAAVTTGPMARDVLKLRDEARRVAMGELTAPVTTRRDDELGEIAGSLERVRLSLQEGLERLRKRRR